MPQDSDYKRRTVLKMTSGLTAGIAAGAVGTAAADDVTVADLSGVDTSACDCYWEHKCEGYCEDDPRYPQYYARECCECDSGTTCDYWSKSGCC